MLYIIYIYVSFNLFANSITLLPKKVNHFINLNS